MLQHTLIVMCYPLLPQILHYQSGNLQEILKIKLYKLQLLGHIMTKIGTFIVSDTCCFYRIYHNN